MRYIISPKAISLTTMMLGVIMIYSCKKEEVSLREEYSAPNHLNFISEEKVKINQAVVVYDATEVRDSIDFFMPTPHKKYAWEIIPNNGCGLISGTNNKGIVKFIFTCSGTYKVAAKIYDSVTQHLIGYTDTISVQVSTDTLHPIQRIRRDDVLHMRPTVVKFWNNFPVPNTPPDGFYLQIYLATEKLYEYSNQSSLNFTSNISATQHTYNFSELIPLYSYPVAYGSGFMDKVYGVIELKDLPVGVPAKLNITWMGVTYTGTITLLNQNKYSLSWTNAGVVVDY